MVLSKEKGLNLIVDGSWETLKRNTGKDLKTYFNALLSDLPKSWPLPYSLSYRLCGRGFDRLRIYTTGEQSPRLSRWRFLFRAFVRSSHSIIAPIFLMGEPFGNPLGLPFPVVRSVNPNGFALPFDRGSGEEIPQSTTGICAMSERKSSWCRTVLSEITFFALCICCFEVCSLIAHYSISGLLRLVSFVGGAV